jgi:CSLREA domain-containing protein
VALAPLTVILGASPAAAATIEVTSTADNKTNDQLCTLREAVDATNANAAVNPAGGDDCPAGEATLDTIELDFDTYTIAGPPSNEAANASGDFDVDVNPGGPLIIDGAGQGNTTIDANDNDRVLQITGSGTATIRDLSVEDGTVTDTVGGGIRSGATDLTLERVTVSSNFVAGAVPSVARGGGLSVGGGEAAIIDSDISGNAVHHLSGQPASATTLPSGGGAHMQSTDSVTIDRSTVSNNQISSANTSQDLQGGGLSTSFDVQEMTITGTTISGNNLNGGDDLTGAGMDWDGGSGPELTIENSTFDDNSAVGGDGGGLHVADGSVEIAHTTFGPSTVNSGASIFIVAGPVEIRGSVLDNEGTDKECGPVQPTSLGYNVERGTGDECGLDHPSDLLKDGQLLDPTLEPNGGPTETRAPLLGGPLIDGIPSDDCLGVDGDKLLQDQRGVPRLFDEDGDSIPECEPGALEVSRCRGVLVNVVGTQGDDGFIGGTTAADGVLALGGGDAIDADNGVDAVCGGEGSDLLVDQDSDDDLLDGGAGVDQFGPDSFDSDNVNFATGVASTLIDSDQVFAIENVFGGFGDDTLVGDAGPNLLDGGFDDDTVTGGGGTDDLRGGPGAGVDSIFARDGLADLIDCGAGTDTAQTDQPSLETTTACESVDALAEPVFPANPSPTTTPKKKCKKGRKLKKGKCVKKKRKK